MRRDVQNGFIKRHFSIPSINPGIIPSFFLLEMELAHIHLEPLVVDQIFQMWYIF
jgi:hypothetical protein